MKVELLRRLRKRFAWKYDSRWSKYNDGWKIFDKKKAVEIFNYDYNENGDECDNAIYNMMKRLGIGNRFKSRYSRIKARETPERKKRLLYDWLNS